MTALTWVARFFVFAVLLVFAAQNTEPVFLRIWPGAAWEAPLVIALLAFFVGGVLLGALSLLGVIVRQRREIAQLRRSAQGPKATQEIPLPPVL